ncbi:MAG: ATP-binding protein [Sphingomicrobium sp.]
MGTETGWSSDRRSKSGPTVEHPLAIGFKPLCWSAAACAAGLGLLGLVGWAFNYEAFGRPGLWLIAMTPVASFAFLLAFIALTLLTGSIVTLFHIDRLRRSCVRAMLLSEGHYRHAEQVGHIGHWRIEYPSGSVHWSDELYEIMGLPKTTKPSMEIKYAMYHPDDCEDARETVAAAIRDGLGWEVSHRILRPDGEIRHVRSHGIPERNAQGDITLIFGVLADMTTLELAQREAEAATASKAAFLAIMSHEIRTPMNGVMGFVELLMDSELDAKQRRHLLLVQDSAQVLLKLLNDILDLSKIEAHQFDLSAEPSDIRHDIGQCVRLMTPIAEQKGLELRATFADGFPSSVLIDSLRLRQILFNLLGNAVKFTHEGSVCVTLAERQASGGERIMEIKVADTGVGIAEARKGAIFDAFVQADASISRRYGGSGLGLAISQRLALLMGGAIALDSAENEGTTITLTLPLDEVFAPALAGITPVVPNIGAILDTVGPMRQQASILLVEDIDINRELITEMLQRLGHRVDVAENGSIALSLAHGLEENPQMWDMILMDVQMPVMDGLTATRAIRALGGRAGTIPIVALTANAFAAEMQECADAGMNDHVAKPSGSAELKKAIDLWCIIAESPTPVTDFREPEIVSVADRFDARMRKSTVRLTEIGTELAGADHEGALRMLREAMGIAHVLSGTAGMFGRAPLGKVAQQTEAELKFISKHPPEHPNAKATESIELLVAALDASKSGAAATKSQRSVISGSLVS